MPRAGRLTVLLVAISLAAGNLALGAQEPLGELRGEVVDAATFAPVSGASLRVLGTELGALVDQRGEFVLRNVPAGVHSVTVQRLGYRTATVADVVVYSARTTRLVVELVAVPLELEGIEVDAGLFRRPAREPVSSVSLSAEEVRRAPGLTVDLSRTLAALPAFAQLGDARNDLLVRGGSSMENGFYIDNIPVPNINHFPNEAHTGGPIGMLNLSFIRDVRASVGGFSAVYGDRLSSIVEIQYREGNRQEVDGEVLASMAGFGLGAEGPLPEGRGSWMASASRSYLDLLVGAIGTGGVAPRYGDAQGKVVLDLGPRHSLTGLGIAGNSGIAFDRELESQEELEDQDFYGEYTALQWTGGVNWRALWTDRLHSNTSVSVSRIGAAEEFHDRLDDALEFRADNADRSASVRNVTSFVARTGRRLDFGAEATASRARYDYTFPAVTDGPPEDRHDELTVRDQIRSGKAAAFASTTIPLGRLTGTVGLRAEHSDLNDRTVLLPRLSASYLLTERLRLNAATGGFAQTLPVFMVSQDPANRELPHPRAAHYIVGADLLLSPALQLTVEGYHKSYSHLPLNPLHPERFPVDDGLAGLGQLHGRLVGGGRATSQGVELVAQRRRVDRFHGLVSATYFRSRYRDLNGVWRDRIYDNRVIGQVLAGYQPRGSAWDLSARWIYGGGTPYTPLDPEQSRETGRTVFDLERTNAERLPAYHALHLRVERRHHFRSSTLVWGVSLTNAYARKNIRTYRWNRTRGEVEPIYNLGLLPVAGLEYRF